MQGKRFWLIRVFRHTQPVTPGTFLGRLLRITGRVSTRKNLSSSGNLSGLVGVVTLVCSTCRGLAMPRRSKRQAGKVAISILVQTFGDISRYGPAEGLLVVDLCVEDRRRGYAVPDPRRLDVNDTGDFVSAGTKLIVLTLVGSMDGPAVSSHWYRFGVEEAAYRSIYGLRRSISVRAARRFSSGTLPLSSPTAKKPCKACLTN